MGVLFISCLQLDGRPASGVIVSQDARHRPPAAPSSKRTVPGPSSTPLSSHATLCNECLLSGSACYFPRSRCEHRLKFRTGKAGATSVLESVLNPEAAVIFSLWIRPSEVFNPARAEPAQALRQAQDERFQSSFHPHTPVEVDEECRVVLPPADARQSHGSFKPGDRAAQVGLQAIEIELEDHRRSRHGSADHGRRNTGSRFSINALTPSPKSGWSISSRWRCAS